MANTCEQPFEANVESHLTDQGWSFLSPDGYDRRLGLFPDEVATWLADSQPKAWQQLVTRHSGAQVARQKVVEALADAVDHRGTLSLLRDGFKNSGVPIDMATFRPASGLNQAIAGRYAANRLAVVRQLHHSESNPSHSVDVTLVLNGIPVATAELKNPLTGQTVENAKTQYREDRNPHDLIFRGRTLVHFAVDQHHVAMTTRLAGRETRFLPFDQGSNGPGHPGTAGNPTSRGYQTAYLWEEVWQRDAWLELLGSFIQQRKARGGEWEVLFPRYHQWHAVRSILQATYEDGAGVDRLIQHSAGSGKSNTIAWSAHLLSRLHGKDDAPIFDKVVVLTDRKVLDKQLQNTVAGLQHTEGTIVRIDKDSKQLKAALEGNAARIIITTLQKFPVVIELAKKQQEELGDSGQVMGRKFAVIVDEAHSSTSGTAFSGMKKVLKGDMQAALEDAEAAEATDGDEPSEAENSLLESANARGKQSNLSFFAFTATPKPKTLDIFGQMGEDRLKRPFHTYSMRQAIAEGFILDVLASYTTYDVYYKLVNTNASHDPSIDTRKGRAALARHASLHPHMMEGKAEVIVEHFRAKTAHKIGGRAKAMVVTRSRLHAMKTHEAIQRYITKKGYDRGPGALRTLVAFSGAVSDPDAPEVSVTESALNGFPESELPRRFHDEYQVLVVAEKYQTGFDEPLLHTMYVDKKLSGVAAVQTLSRLNRTTPGKDDTFVLDFANSAEEIQAAFEPFYEESLAQPTDPQVLHTMEQELKHAGVLVADEMQQAVELVLDGTDKDQERIYHLVGQAVGRWVLLNDRDPDAAEAFRGQLDAFCRAYTFIAQVMPWADPEQERLYLFGKLLLADLPRQEGDPMPQISKSVQLSHLRISAQAEASIVLDGDAEPGDALPGEGKGAEAEPMADRLSALIAVLNEKFGADLDDADRLWFEQQTMVVGQDSEMQEVRDNNDRAAYKLVVDHKLEDMMLERDQRNGQLFTKFFENLDFRQMMVEHIVSATYDDWRQAAG
ncbi:type I restriction endonuclease subunit R [Kytococcus sedentarius]|uniref:type I restriction endonuclease subunit R n=1 Tax=Kytococcus sedentarius TaxID=1276 RepID=UPI0035BC20F7